MSIRNAPPESPTKLRWPDGEIPICTYRITRQGMKRLGEIRLGGRRTGESYHCVPLKQDRSDGPGPSPFPDAWLAWRYLLPQACMRRCVERIDVYSIRLGRRFLDVDLQIPYSHGAQHPWIVPLAFLDKDPIAPDLTVRDASGTVVVAPTREENIAITCDAVRLIATKLGISLTPVTSDLLIQIVRGDVEEAQLARFVFEDELEGEAPDLVDLLYRLESQTLLWIRLDGEGGEDRHMSLERRAPRYLDPVLQRYPVWTGFSLPVADGFADFIVPVAGPRRRLDFRELADRILLTFGLRPIEVASVLADTARFSSFHHRVHAPRGFVVRHIRVSRPVDDNSSIESDVVEELMDIDAAEFDDPPPEVLENEVELRATAREQAGGELARKQAESEDEVLYEPLPSTEFTEITPGPGLLIQGHDSEIAHVHCSGGFTSSPIVVNTTLGTSPHLTSLWSLVVVLSAALLWLFDRRSPYPPFADVSGHLEVAAGALLLVPTFAAAWVIRSDETAATRLVLSGTRFLLMLCGALSVCAALSLGGILPRHIAGIVTVKFYASIAYLAAAVVGVSWVVSLRATWYLYRDWLTKPSTHMLVALMVILVAIALNLLAPVLAPCRYLCGLGLLALATSAAANAAAGGQIRPDNSQDGGIAPSLLSGLAAAVIFLSAGYWLRFYDEVLSASTVRLATVAVLALLAAGLCRVREKQRWVSP